MKDHTKESISGVAVYVPTGAVDTGSKALAPRLKSIRGARIDVWTSSCKDARRFGIQKGTTVLVQRERPPQPQQAGEPRPR